MRKFIVKEYCPMHEDMVVAGVFEWSTDGRLTRVLGEETKREYAGIFNSTDDVRQFIYNRFKTDDGIINITEE